MIYNLMSLVNWFLELIMSRKRRGQSIGEMISSVTFFALAVYAMLLGFEHFDAGTIQKAILSWLAMVMCGAASIRFLIADWIGMLKRMLG